MSDEDENDDEDSNSRVTFPIQPSRAASPEIIILPDEELLPPEPSGRCTSELQDKISRLYDKMTKEGINMNFSIQQLKKFRNPSLYEKFIELLDIEEH
jgi:HCNGP-like protein